MLLLVPNQDFKEADPARSLGAGGDDGALGGLAPRDVFSPALRGPYNPVLGPLSGHLCPHGLSSRLRGRGVRLRLQLR